MVTQVPEKRLQAPSALIVAVSVPYTASFSLHCPTPGALQGDDYPLEFHLDGYPKIPACLDRRQALELQSAA